MESTPASPLVLPPALTYLIAREFDRARARRGAGAGVSTARLDGLLRDAVRFLLASGATLAEAQAAVRDVCEAAHAWRADPELRTLLGELEARARDYAAAPHAAAPDLDQRNSRGA
jgi:hypothetical protein